MSNNYSDIVGSKPRLVTRGAEKALVARVDREIPNPVDDLKPIVESLILEDLRHIDYVVLVGERKAVKVDTAIAYDAVGDRRPPEEIIEEIRSEFSEDGYTARIVDRDLYQVIAVHTPLRSVREINDPHGDQVRGCIEELEFDRDQILSIYFLAEQDHVRVDPTRLFKEIDGVKQDPDKIILGKSPAELIGLLAQRLRKHRTIRDAVVVDGSGVEYPVDLIAMGPSTILARYAEESTGDEVWLLGLLCRAIGADAGILLVDEKQRQGDGLVEVLTVEDL